jgi:Sulfotransferase family
LKSFPRQYNLQSDDVLYYSHIPKTAGMTFRTIIEDHFDHDEICPATLDNEIHAIANLTQYRLFRGHLVYVDFKTLLPQKQIINLTMLRDPVAQLVSHYHYIRRMPENPYYAKVKEMTLDEYAASFTMGELRRNVQTYHIAKAARFDIDHLSAQEIYEIAVDSLDHFAFAGLVERFQDSLFLLSYIFGWRPMINNRQENVTQTTNAISEATLQLIQESTQLDQKIYQQAQQIFSDRHTQMLQDLQEKYDPHASLASQLENHYQHRYQTLNITPASTYRYSFSQALRGSGWQRREYPTQGLIYRWTGPDRHSTLDLPIALAPDLLIEFRVICANFTAADILNSLTLTINERPVPLAILHRDPVTLIFRGNIPTGEVANQPTRLTFKVNRIVAFRSLNPQDPDLRSVGIAINEVRVFPSAEEAQNSFAFQLLLEREFWQDPIDFLRIHLRSTDRIIAPLSFMPPLRSLLHHSNMFKPSALNNAQWVVIQKDQTENISKTLLGLFLRRFRPVFANRVFVIFTTHSELPKLDYTSMDVKPLYVDILKRRFRKFIALFSDVSGYPDRH